MQVHFSHGRFLSHRRLSWRKVYHLLFCDGVFNFKVFKVSICFHNASKFFQVHNKVLINQWNSSQVPWRPADMKLPVDLFSYFLLLLPCLLAPKIKPSVVMSQRFWLPWRLAHSPNPRETSATNLAERARWHLSYKCWLSPPGKCTESHSQSLRQYCRPRGPAVWAGTGREFLGCWELALRIHIIYSQLLSPQTNNKDNNHKGRKKEQKRKPLE